MDIEKGSCSTASSNRGASSKLLITVPILVSCVALAGTLLLFVQNQQMQADMERLSSPERVRSVWTPDASQQEQALREVHDMVKGRGRFTRATSTATNYACQNRRRNENFYKDCTDSPRTPSSVPSAHIVPDGYTFPCTIPNPSPNRYGIISVGWTCGATHPRVTLPAYVRGGMIFNRSIGALVVPVEGIYFVYSQVHINVSNPTESVPTGTQMFICEEEFCRATPYLVSRALTDVTYGPYYHGGLFHLNANSTIKVAAWYDSTVGRRVDPHAESIAYQAYFQNTFFGAYLVEEIAPK